MYGRAVKDFVVRVRATLPREGCFEAIVVLGKYRFLVYSSV